MGCMKNKPVNLIISKDIENVLPEYLINMIRYLWETECKHQETRFILDKSDISHQSIIICVGEKEIKSTVIPCDNPTTATVSFRQDINFIMDLE